jgi:hypothetical protein
LNILLGLITSAPPSYQPLQDGGVSILILLYLPCGFHTLMSRVFKYTAPPDPQGPEETPMSKAIPNEVFNMIICSLQADNDLAALAAVARANQHMYDLAIPKLYETVTMTDWNEDQIGYGTSERLKTGDGTFQVRVED